MSLTPRSPSDSASSLNSPGDSRPNGASLGQHSTSALILVHDTDHEEDGYGLSDEEDEEDMVAEEVSGPASTELMLSPSVVFGYLLSPCLKLGAMLVLSSQAPVSVSLPSVLVFSLLSAFSRQIWFLLARYTRKSDIGDIFAEAFLSRYGHDNLRALVKGGSRCLSSAQRVLLATVYMKGAKSSMEQLWTTDISPIPPSLSLSVIFMAILIPLSVAPSLASRRLIYATGVSNALFIIWLGGIVYAHARGLLNTDNVMVAQGVLSQDITSAAFAFTSLSTLQLYSGMVGLYANSDKKEKRYLSISSVSFYASLVGTGLVLPLLFPSVKSHGGHEVTEDSITFQAFIATTTAFILLLAIPPLMSSAQPVPLPSTLRRVSNRPFGKYLLLLLLFLLSLLPPSVEPILEDATVFLVLLSTYFLPALLHIVLHHVRSPLSILIPSRPQPLLRSGSNSESDEDDGREAGYDPHTEELLHRKEHALQRRRFARRLAWDAGVWILLLPVGGGGIVWSVGRLANAW